MSQHEERADRVAQIVRDAGGSIVGKTRLQKIAYLLELAGLGSGYQFSYHYYGPYSSTLEDDAQIAWAFDAITRDDRIANWGGKYSIYSVSHHQSGDSAREKLATIAANIDSVELELAATAALLSAQGYERPWEETANRKPDKATPERVAAAMDAYRQLKSVKTPQPLPNIV